MTEYDLIIRGGTVASAGTLAQCDVAIRDGKIAALGTDLGAAKEEIDAKGQLVLPGGIDAHCHIAQRSSTGLETSDDFLSGTRSALCGGTTTILPFAAQHRGDSLIEVVANYHGRAEGNAMIDYGFHLIVSDPSARVLDEELPELIRQGFSSFKIYTTYDSLKLDDRQILDVLTVAKTEGALVMVHAENHDVIAWLSQRLLQAGKTQPKYHADSRVSAAEREATHRAITFAEVVGVPMLIVHVSGREAIEQIRHAQSRGLKIYGETCPQYLFLTGSDMDRDGFEGAKYMCSPPPRDKANQEHVWNGLTTGVFQVFSSDHAPYRYDDKDGKQRLGKSAPFTKIANGVPGLEIRLALLFSEGVRRGRLSIDEFVNLTATQPAKLYGLYPRKGTISIGADADIAIWDPNKEVTISQSMLHDNMDYTPYEGQKCTGWPVVTISRGDVVWKDGKILAQPGRGQFLRREKTFDSRNVL